ncbi:MAG: RHS repeat-associated core domain-containing protein [Nitrospira sp.]|nr:RHS repeat-associated core domain-containing protein [Nitrospira sp.]
MTELTDINGVVARAYAYDAYGNLLESPGAVEQPYTYTGREFDAETGLYYYRARYYDSTTGRFLRKDPLRFINGTNLYAYTMNSPTNFADALGLWRNPSNIYDEAMRRAQNSPFPDPHNGLQDAYRHCLASCMLACENSEFEARILGWANEKRGDWFHNQEEGEREADEANNKCGRGFGQTANSTQDCEQSCGNAARNGTLQTYHQGTTPHYWDTRLSWLP